MYPYVTPVHLLEQAIVSSMRKVEREEVDAVAQGGFSNNQVARRSPPTNEEEDVGAGAPYSKLEVRADSAGQEAIGLQRRI